MAIFKNAKKQVLKKLVILQLIDINSKETRVITYTCRYSSAHLIPITQSCQNE